jgi:hypothetical protein
VAIVTVDVPDLKIHAKMSEMRTWLDSKGIEPLRFRLATVEGRPVACLEFNSLSDAEDFALHFNGRLRLSLSQSGRSAARRSQPNVNAGA